MFDTKMDDQINLLYVRVKREIMLMFKLASLPHKVNE